MERGRACDQRGDDDWSGGNAAGLTCLVRTAPAGPLRNACVAEGLSGGRRRPSPVRLAVLLLLPGGRAGDRR
jgi:hypothetical protein